MAQPINFTVVFSEAVNDFATGDVTLSGTAPGMLVATVTGSGTTYNVAVSGMTNAGTVVATIAAGKAHDAAGNANLASTSLDDSVTYANSAPSVLVTPPSSPQTGNVTISYRLTDAESERVQHPGAIQCRRGAHLDSAMPDRREWYDGLDLPPEWYSAYLRLGQRQRHR